jgi:hypothetical protein
VDKAVNLHAAMAKKKNVELVTNVDIAQLHRIGTEPTLQLTAARVRELTRALFCACM